MNLERRLVKLEASARNMRDSGADDDAVCLSPRDATFLIVEREILSKEVGDDAESDRMSEAKEWIRRIDSLLERHARSRRKARRLTPKEAMAAFEKASLLDEMSADEERQFQRGVVGELIGLPMGIA